MDAIHCRYGYNGKENDQEEGWQDYGERLYNPKLSRFFSVDPAVRKYPAVPVVPTEEDNDDDGEYIYRGGNPGDANLV